MRRWLEVLLYRWALRYVGWRLRRLGDQGDRTVEAFVDLAESIQAVREAVHAECDVVHGGGAPTDFNPFRHGRITGVSP